MSPSLRPWDLNSRDGCTWDKLDIGDLPGFMTILGMSRRVRWWENLSQDSLSQAPE